jgi:hypothetical protein
MKGMKKLLGVIGILALAAALLPAAGYADYRGSYAPITIASGFVNGAEQAAIRPVDVDGLMLIPVDGRLVEEWVAFSTRSLVPGHESVRSIWLHLNSQQSGYFAALLNDPSANISYFDPAWSSDGRFLAYVQSNADGTGQTLYVQEYFANDDFELDHGGSYDPGQGAESPVGSPILVQAGGNPRHPNWQPGSHTLAFESNTAGSPDIYTIDVDTSMGTVSNLTRRTFNDQKAEVSPSWSPNGHDIVYSTNKFGPNVLEIIDLNLVSSAPGYTRLAEINFNGTVSHNNADWSSDGGTLYYDAPGSEDPNGLTTIWSIKLSTQAKCEINLDPSRADGDPDVSNIQVTSNDGIPFNYFMFTSQAAGFGVAIWRGNAINACQLPLEMGVAMIPSIMDLNDSTTTTFQTVMNFPPETRDAGYACFFPAPYTGAAVHGGSFPAPPGKDSVKPRTSIVTSPTLMGLVAPNSASLGAPFPDCYDSLAKGLTDSLRIACNWNFRTIADRIVALGLVDKIVPLKMTAYSNGTGRTFQGFGYLKLTKSSLPAAGVALLGNSPNPFNPVTKIKFAVSKAGNYTLRLYNVQGALVKTVASGHYDVGVHEAAWDGRTNAGGKAASGVYYARISGSAKEGSSGIKLVLAK